MPSKARSGRLRPVNYEFKPRKYCACMLRRAFYCLEVAHPPFNDCARYDDKGVCDISCTSPFRKLNDMAGINSDISASNDNWLLFLESSRNPTPRIGIR